MRIFLTGFMGVGKSYLGRELARLLHYDFADLDDQIVAGEGMAISEIFKLNGEAHFRELEAECLRNFSSRENIVVATGGGAPCFHQNMDWMNEHGVTIHLNANIAILASRLMKEFDKRPLLAGLSEGKLTQYIEEKLAERSQFYHQANLTFEVQGQGTEEIGILVNYLKRLLPKNK